MKKGIAIISIIVFLTLTFIACGSANGEDTLKDFITAFYTVNQNDYDYCQKMMNGAKESELEDFFKSYETNSKKFEQYLTNKSYQSFYASRLSYLRALNAYKNNCLVEIKGLKINKTGQDKKEKTITYHYQLQLNQINKDTKKVETIEKSGILHVINENGQWKILDRIDL